MEEKERYSYWQGTFAVVDNKTGKRYDYVVDLLNQQDKEIKRFMSMKNREQLVVENEALKDTIAVVLAQKRNLSKLYRQLKDQLSNEEKSHDLCIKDFEMETEKLRKQIKFESDARERFKAENQKLAMELFGWKQQFNSIEKKYMTSIANYTNTYNKKVDEIKSLEKENKQLKQSQKQLAISEIEKVRGCCEKFADSLYDNLVDVVLPTDIDKPSREAMKYLYLVSEFIDNQIKKLKGDK